LVLAGLIALLVNLAQREPLPISVWFAIVMNIGVNLTQAFGVGEMPVISEAVRPMLFWLFQVIMFCYLIRNSATEKRLMVFITIMLGIVVYLGGQITRDDRLMLERFAAGSSFGNANQLSYMTGLFAIALLFWSLRAAVVLRPVLWLLAAAMAFLMLKTGSRGGAATFGCGLIMLVLTILMGRGVRISGTLMAAVIVIGVSQAWFLVADPLEVLSRRAGQHSIRSDVYRWELLDDLWNTKIFGVGPAWAYTSTANIQAHNSFIYAHQAYGGITAWPYLLWLLVLGTRITRFLLSRDFPLDRRMMVATLFGMSLCAQILSNHGYMFFSSLFAIGVIEKYTAPYSRRRIRERRWAAYEPAQDWPGQTAYA
ncbi:MAG: hypothetical protein HRF43_02565, partial [Phycisphaerae bacterium]